MGMIDTSAFRKGLKIEIDDAPWSIVEFQHVKPGKGSAFVRTRIKNLLTNNTIDRTFRSGDTVGEADCEEISCDYLYNDGANWFFMNQESYEQFEVALDAVGDAKDFLIDGNKCSVLLYKNRPIAIEVANFITAKLIDCDPAVAGNTAQGATKLVTTETGYKVAVPLYITINDVLKIDTRDGRYVERVNK
jgi:elongation factor P